MNVYCILVNSSMETYVKAENIETAAMSMIFDYCIGSVPYVKLMNNVKLSRNDLIWSSDGGVDLPNSDIGLFKVDNSTKLMQLSTACDVSELNELEEGGSYYIDQLTNIVYQHDSDLFSNNTVTTSSEIYYKASAIREYMNITQPIREDMISILNLPKYKHDIYNLQRKLVKDGLFDPYSVYLLMTMTYNVVRAVNINGDFSWLGDDILTTFKALYDREIDLEVGDKLMKDAENVKFASSSALQGCMEGFNKPNLSLVP